VDNTDVDKVDADVARVVELLCTVAEVDGSYENEVDV